MIMVATILTALLALTACSDASGGSSPSAQPSDSRTAKEARVLHFSGTEKSATRVTCRWSVRGGPSASSDARVCVGLPLRL
jgi:hypothetical protein